MNAIEIELGAKAEERSSAFVFGAAERGFIRIQCMRIFPVFLTVIFLLATALTGQTTAPVAQPPQAPACPSTSTLDALIVAIDAAVSGPADKERTCFREIFLPDARLSPIVKTKEGDFEPHLLTVDGWVDAVRQRGNAVLGEHQIRVEKLEWGHLAHLWSTYELTVDGKPAARGINSIQAVNDGKRWRVISIVWQAENEAEKIPGKFLPAGR